MNVYYNHSLKELNTFGVDVKAKKFVEIFNESYLGEFLRKNNESNVLILGSGSNILFTKDFDGVIIKYLGNSVNILYEDEKEAIVKAEAGLLWDEFVSYTVKNNLNGLENLSLIPGTVGAAPVQNIGAYGVEVADYIECVEGFFIYKAEKKILHKDECLFSYRDSIFKNKLKNKFVITSVNFRLSKNKRLSLSYRDLKEFFRDKDVNCLTALNVRDAIIKIRKSKLPDTNQLGNAGSFFKNPEVSYSTLEKIKSEFPGVPFHKIDNKFKIPAAWLIEKCGYKGKKIGNVGTYEKHALIIVNYGNATGQEIKNFADEIKKAVLTKFNIDLEYEVNII